MNILDTLTISLTSLRRNKIRTFLTSFAVFIGVFIIIFLVSLSFGAQKLLISQITNQFDIRSIFVVKKGSLNLDLLSTTAKEEDEEKVRLIDNQAISDISKLEDVEFVDPVISLNGRKFEFVDKDFDDRVVGSASGAGWDLREGDQLVTEVLAGRYTNLQKGEAIITKNIVDAYDKEPSEFIGQTIKLSDQGGILGQSSSRPSDPFEYKIVGVVGAIRNFVYLTSSSEALEQVAKRNEYENVEDYVEEVGYQSLYVKAKNEQVVKNVTAEIKDLGYDANSLEDILTLFNTFFNIIPIIFTIVGAIAIFVASIGIINTMIMSVFERTKEIGVMKAVGAKNSNILLLFITEAGLIGFIGGTLAVGVSLLVIAIVERIVVNNILPSLEITNIKTLFETPVWLIVITVGVSTIVGILAGLYPAIRASRLDPVKALRYE